MNALPQRIQDQLAQAEVLEAAELAARAGQPSVASNVADLIQPLVAVPSATPQIPATPVASPANDDATWEQRYRTLQGMHKQELRAVDGRVAALTEQVQALVAAKTAQPADVPKPEVNPKDIENFGEQMMEMVQRYVTDVMVKLDSRIKAVEGALTGVTQKTEQTAQETFYQLLTQLCPQWRAVNEDQRWLVWLGVKDEVYGLPRQAALDNAFNRQDAAQVAKVFNAFIASIPVTPAVPSLDDQVQPDSSANPTPAAPTQKPILSEKSITDFYNEVSRGKYVGREAEAAAVEEAINLAVAEGRVRK